MKLIKNIRRSRLTRRFKPSRRGRYSNKVSRSNYKFPIALDPILWDNSVYTTQNLNIDVLGLLTQNTQFQTLKNMYQYFRVDGVSLKAIPQPVNGTYPPTAWAYLLGHDAQSIQYAAIPRLPGAKIVPATKTTTRFFRRVGRQADFGWYNDDINGASQFSIRLRFAQLPSEAGFLFQLKVFLTFSMLIEFNNNKESEFAEVLQYTKSVNPKVVTALMSKAELFNKTTENLDISAISMKSEKSYKSVKSVVKYDFTKEMDPKKILSYMKKQQRNKITVHLTPEQKKIVLDFIDQEKLQKQDERYQAYIREMRGNGREPTEAYERFADPNFKPEIPKEEKMEQQEDLPPEKDEKPTNKEKRIQKKEQKAWVKYQQVLLQMEKLHLTNVEKMEFLDQKLKELKPIEDKYLIALLQRDAMALQCALQKSAS